MIRAALALILIVTAPAAAQHAGLYVGLTALASGAVLAIWSRK